MSTRPLQLGAVEPEPVDPRTANATKLMDKKPPSEQQVMHTKLKGLREGIAETLSTSHRVLEDTSKLLVGYFGKIPEKQLSERIRLTFDAFDSNKNGSLEPDELAEALAEMGKRPSEEEVRELLNVFDQDNNGAIEIGEFEHMVRQHLKLPPSSQCPCNVCIRRRAEEEEEARLEQEAAEAEAEAEAAAPSERLNTSMTDMSITSTSEPNFKRWVS